MNSSYFPWSSFTQTARSSCITEPLVSVSRVSSTDRPTNWWYRALSTKKNTKSDKKATKGYKQNPSNVNNVKSSWLNDTLSGRWTTRGRHHSGGSFRHRPLASSSAGAELADVTWVSKGDSARQPSRCLSAYICVLFERSICLVLTHLVSQCVYGKYILF